MEEVSLELLCNKVVVLEQQTQTLTKEVKLLSENLKSTKEEQKSKWWKKDPFPNWHYNRFWG